MMAAAGKRRQSLARPGRFFGITQTGFLDRAAFADIVRSLQYGVNEMMCHPGYADDDLRRTSTRLHVQREAELELLTGREVRDLLDRAGVALVSFRNLVDSV